MSYSHTNITNKFLKDLLKDVQKDISGNISSEEINIHDVWAQVIGEKLSALTSVKSFNQGILVIKVTSASLNQLLSTTEKPKILKKLKTDFAFLKVKTVVFKTS